MNDSRRLMKPLAYALIVSVIIGALLGIVFVLRNTWGWFEVRVMLTTVVVAVASLYGLASDLSRLPQGHNALPRAALLLTGISAGLLLFGMWCEVDTEAFWKAAITTCIFATATVHVCLLSIARLVGRFRWVLYIAIQLVYGLACLLTVVIVGGAHSAQIWQFIAALSILVAAITLVIPILHRIGRMESDSQALLMPIGLRNLAKIEQEIASLRQRISQLEQMKQTILQQTG